MSRRGRTRVEGQTVVLKTTPVGSASYATYRTDTKHRTPNTGTLRRERERRGEWTRSSGKREPRLFLSESRKLMGPGFAFEMSRHGPSEKQRQFGMVGVHLPL